MYSHSRVLFSLAFFFILFFFVPKIWGGISVSAVGMEIKQLDMPLPRSIYAPKHIHAIYIKRKVGIFVYNWSLPCCSWWNVNFLVEFWEDLQLFMYLIFFSVGISFCISSSLVPDFYGFSMSFDLRYTVHWKCLGPTLFCIKLCVIAYL